MKQLLTIVLATVAIAAQSHAELLAGTPESAPDAGRVAVGEWGFGAGSPILQARPFATGGTAYYLDALNLDSHFSWESGSGELSVSLYSDNAGVPGSVVTGGQNLFTATAGTIDQMLDAGSTLTLAAHSTYWLVASVDQLAGATRCWWNLTDSSLFDSDVTGTDLPLLRANDASGWTAYPDASMQMSIYGSVVPEPGTVPLLCLAGLGSFLLRRGRFKRSRTIASDSFTPVVYHIPFLAGERHGRYLNSARHRKWQNRVWIPLEFESEDPG